MRAYCCCFLQVPGVLKVLLERLRNEITRLPAVKGFGVLAHSKLELGLDGALEPVVVGGFPWFSCPFQDVSLTTVRHQRQQQVYT